MLTGADLRQAEHIYEFGRFRIETVERRLLCGGQVIPLTPKLYETLLVLVENSGHTLEKEELLGAHSDDVDQSFRSDADQSGAKRRRTLSV